MAFLQTELAYQRDGFGWLADRIRRRLAERTDWEELIHPSEYEEMNVRVVEYHRQTAPGPGISEYEHYDMDSVVTIDVCLSEESDWTGGQFGTLEPTGVVETHRFGKGDAVAFLSHKFHCVSKVQTGVRRVLVIELWRGPDRSCPHRCCSFGQKCPSEKDHSVALQPRIAPALPFRLAAVGQDGTGAARQTYA